MRILENPDQSAGDAMKQVCVLGNGQLGECCAGRANRWKVSPSGRLTGCRGYRRAGTSRASLREIERWPGSTREWRRHPAFVNRDGTSHRRPSDTKQLFRQAGTRDRAVAAADEAPTSGRHL